MKLARYHTATPVFRQPRFWWGVCVVLICIFLIRYCSSGADNHKKAPALPVVTAVAQSKDMPIYLSALGTVTPTYTVTVRTQINGQLLRVLFREGQLVKAGDLLAEIDPRPYQAQLIQYEGQLLRDQALLDNAKLDLKRYKTLWKQDSVAKQVLDTQVALVKQYEGTVKIDQGLLDSTKLNLKYCNITSPIDGRVGLRLVDPGNFVQTSDATGLAVIDMQHPITVVFTLPEDTVPDVVEQVNAGKILIVNLFDRAQNKKLATGRLLTMDNQIDPTTGTVKLKATFENKQNTLFPNQFVNVQLWVKTLQHATVVPTAAIQPGAQGSFVYLLGGEKQDTVSIKPVVVGVTVGDLTSVTGLSVGQSVVVEGADKLTDGATVALSNTSAGSNSKSLPHRRTKA
jgi:multidrug efflux system membrane fusion protein